ncbi:hypothetical protein LUZ60_005956 [Juncus effusus]|nr:hypothetical protein LUZ60_005956 [Juncus effusus]
MVHYGSINNPLHHNHPLALKKDLSLFKCDGCLEIGLGDGYTCKNDTCDFQLHKQCVKDFNKQIRSINFNCTLILLKEPKKMVICSICGDAINGYVYSCKDNCYQINLHPVCAELPRYIWIDDTQYEIEKKMKRKCTRCNHTKIPQLKDIWAYHSSKAKQHYHVWCMKKLVVEKWEEATSSCTTQGLSLKYAETSTSTSTGRVAQRESKMVVFGKSLGALTSVACAVLGVSDPTAPVRKLLIKEN